MTDKELLQEALNQLEHYETKPEFNSNINKTIDALRARLSTCDRCGKVNPAELHTCTPPQRGWVGLTDEDIEDCLEMSIQGTCRAIEAKLKEKNHAA